MKNVLAKKMGYACCNWLVRHISIQKVVRLSSVLF